MNMDTYTSVQLEMARRAEQFAKPHETGSYPFTGRITCACCGKHYRRKIRKTGPVWICTTYNTLGKAACPSKAIPETVLDSLIDEMGGISEITDIHAHNDKSLVLTLADGEQIVKLWQDRSRRQSWTPEMKEATRQKAVERRAYQNAC